MEQHIFATHIFSVHPRAPEYSGILKCFLSYQVYSGEKGSPHAAVGHLHCHLGMGPNPWEWPRQCNAEGRRDRMHLSSCPGSDTSWPNTAQTVISYCTPGQDVNSLHQHRGKLQPHAMAPAAGTGALAHRKLSWAGAEGSGGGL